jgi:hypothetical protein
VIGRPTTVDARSRGWPRLDLAGMTPPPSPGVCVRLGHPAADERQCTSAAMVRILTRVSDPSRSRLPAPAGQGIPPPRPGRGQPGHRGGRYRVGRTPATEPLIPKGRDPPRPARRPLQHCRQSARVSCSRRQMRMRLRLPCPQASALPRQLQSSFTRAVTCCQPRPRAATYAASNCSLSNHWSAAESCGNAVVGALWIRAASCLLRLSGFDPGKMTRLVAGLVALEVRVTVVQAK